MACVLQCFVTFRAILKSLVLVKYEEIVWGTPGECGLFSARQFWVTVGSGSPEIRSEEVSHLSAGFCKQQRSVKEKQNLMKVIKHLLLMNIVKRKTYRCIMELEMSVIKSNSSSLPTSFPHPALFLRYAVLFFSPLSPY